MFETIRPRDPIMRYQELLPLKPANKDGKVKISAGIRNKCACYIFVSARKTVKC